MKEAIYNIYFEDGTCITISAIGRMEAKILAQAERINKALPYTISTIEKLDY